jgi:two-component system chemotaxis response regulator CheY
MPGVLIVDDSPIMRKFIRRVAEISGLNLGEVREAGNGQEALSLLRDHPASLILTDINMPVMDGGALVRSLKADAGLKQIPVIVVTTDSTVHRMRELLELGADGYVTKPFGPEQLEAALENVMPHPAGGGAC